MRFTFGQWTKDGVTVHVYANPTSRQLIATTTAKPASTSGGIVLVQRQMERGLSPLVSLARAMAVARQNATETGARKEGTKAATGFERRSGWGHNVALYTKSFRPRPGVRLDLTALAILVCLGHLARNGRVLNRGCAAYFTG